MIDFKEKKSEFVEIIGNKSEISNKEKGMIEALKDHVDKNWSVDPAPIHNFYREWFNLVDMTDKYWYDVQDHHRNEKWKSRMLFSILRYFIYNVWALSTSEKFTLWKEFRAYLAKEMTQFN